MSPQNGLILTKLTLFVWFVLAIISVTRSSTTTTITTITTTASVDQCSLEELNKCLFGDYLVLILKTLSESDIEIFCKASVTVRACLSVFGANCTAKYGSIGETLLTEMIENIGTFKTAFCNNKTHIKEMFDVMQCLTQDTKWQQYDLVRRRYLYLLVSIIELNSKNEKGNTKNNHQSVIEQACCAMSYVQTKTTMVNEENCGHKAAMMVNNVTYHTVYRTFVKHCTTNNNNGDNEDPLKLYGQCLPKLSQKMQKLFNDTDRSVAVPDQKYYTGIPYLFELFVNYL